MTEKDFNKAREILDRIKHIEKFSSDIYHNPYIAKERGDGREGNYLSWVDDKNETLKSLILDWCEKERHRLEKEMEEL